MRRLLLLMVITVMGLGFAQAQDLGMDQLKSMQAEKQAAADALLAEAADLQKQIDEFPGWKTGGVGIIGLDLNANDSWYAINAPFSKSNAFGITATAFANNNQEKWFWNNLFNLNLKKIVTNLDSRQDVETDAVLDALDISSLAGYKLNSKWALSAEGKYASTLLNFNRPGKLTVSAGATWLPIPNAVVIFHPLAYEKNFPSGDFVSAAGCKIGATYSAQIIPGVAWSTNLSAFVPYSAGDGTLKQFPLKEGTDRLALDADFDLGADAIATQDVTYGNGDLFNWTWMNTFSTTLFKGIGLGLNVGLRNDQQIANQWQYNRDASYTANSNNPMQFFYNLGLSYTL